MEQLSNTELKSFFSGIVANPSQVDASHIQQLKVLVDLYPQSGIIRSLLARASQTYDQGGFQQRLKSAAVYASDRSVLYNLINYPEKLVKLQQAVEDEPVAFIEDEQEHDAGQQRSTYNYGAAAYHGETHATGYEEETVYEQEPVNFFRETEQAPLPVYEEEAIETYEPLAEQESLQQPEQYSTPYDYGTTHQQVEEINPVGYNYNNIQTAEEEQIPEEEPLPNGYNYNAEPYQEPVTNNYNYNAVDDYQEEAITPYIYEEEEVAPNTYEEENLETQQPQGTSYGYGASAYEDPLPPVPPLAYNPVNYQQEILSAAASASSEIDDEVYDEIVGIEDMGFGFSTVHAPEPAPASEDYEEIINAQYGTPKQEESVTHYENTQPSQPEPVVEEAKPYAFWANNFKTKMEEADEDAPADNDEVEFEMVNEPVKPMFREVAKTVAVTPQNTFKDEKSTVSKYDDDKMPYSFLWWLEKTRQEHADTYQPYVAFKPITREAPRPAAASEELQMQYVENIFHLTSVEQLDIHTRDKRKESEIIDRFIQQDPQMKPPNTEKLDNENKAKKSAEDREELVTETLAKIYLDQALYNKAIATYQKLLLKFPEKSSYFVAQIKLLEKKLN